MIEAKYTPFLVGELPNTITQSNYGNDIGIWVYRWCDNEYVRHSDPYTVCIWKITPKNSKP